MVVEDGVKRLEEPEVVDDHKKKKNPASSEYSKGMPHMNSQCKNTACVRPVNPKPE